MTVDTSEEGTVPLRHSNNETNVLPTFQVHNLLMARYCCQRFLFTKSCKNKKTL